MLGYLVALTLVAEKTLTLVAGHHTDKSGPRKTLDYSIYTYSLAMAGYGFLAKTPLALFFIESYHKIVCNITESTFRSAIHAYARQHHGHNIVLFGAGWQMALCFGELLVLPIYALLACFIGTYVFYIAFAAAVFGVYMMRRYFNARY